MLFLTALLFHVFFLLIQLSCQLSGIYLPEKQKADPSDVLRLGVIERINFRFRFQLSLEVLEDTANICCDWVEGFVARSIGKKPLGSS